jgi:hypothetical protein
MPDGGRRQSRLRTGALKRGARLSVATKYVAAREHFAARACMST